MFTPDAVVAISIAFGVILASWLYDKADPREPPELSPGIPIIGHILGFLTYHMRYFVILQQRTSWPAFSFSVLGQKTYVVTSPAFAHLALKSGTMSMDPLKARIAVPLLGLSKGAFHYLGLDENGHYHADSTLANRKADFNRDLAPGAGLDAISDNIVAQAMEIVNGFGKEAVKVDFYPWLRNWITYSTLVALFGPDCPLAHDEQLIEDVWTFDEYQLHLSMNILPSIIAARGLRARQHLGDAFVEYLNAGGDKRASAAICNFIARIRDCGASVQDNARTQLFSMSMATVNTVPTAAWMMMNVLSNAALFAKLRDEIASVTTVTDETDGRKGAIDISNAEQTCPLLYACYQEALRLGSLPTCNRVALEDTILRDPQTGVEVLLKKGVRVSIPTFVLHLGDALWEGNPETFDPYRFMAAEKDDDRKPSLSRRALGQAFVPYGGGAHLCPGRHLAKREILAIAALLIMGLDFEAADGGSIALPKAASSLGTERPLEPLIARVRRRRQWEDIGWSVRV